MNIKIIVIFCFSIIYGLSEVLLSVRQKHKSIVENSDDKGSLIFLSVAIGTGYFLSFIVASLKTGRIYYWNTLFTIGFLLVSIGLIIRFVALVTLKQYFTYQVSKVENHRLIETGLYKRIRHPGYLGQLIIFFGLSITLSNWISVLLMMIPVLTGYMHRIRIEERFMCEQMGENYIEYKKKTKKLIPGIF